MNRTVAERLRGQRRIIHKVKCTVHAPDTIQASSNLLAAISDAILMKIGDFFMQFLKNWWRILYRWHAVAACLYTSGGEASNLFGRQVTVLE